MFVMGATARASAELAEAQANTAIRLFMGLRRIIASRQPGFGLSG